MSSPSKKRRAARAWMQEQKKQATQVRDQAYQRGISDGAIRMREDMMRLLPDPDRMAEYPLEDGGMQLEYVIPQMPNPYESGPHHKFAFPTFGGLYGGGSQRHVMFRAVDMRLSAKTYGGNVVSLRWFAWEPVDSKEGVEHTSALFSGMRKLGRAVQMLKWMTASPYPTPGVEEITTLVQDCADEMRRRLGKFAPENIPGPNPVW